MQNSNFEDIHFTSNSLRIKDKLLDISRPIVMGILNINANSFYASSRITKEKAILEGAESMVKEDAKILDIGAQSTRPNATKLSLEKELKVISNVVDLLHKEFPATPISIDTFQSEVAKVALDNGAGIVNDISGFSFDEKMIDVLAVYKPAYILMHIQGDFQRMHEDYNYEDITADIVHYFNERCQILQKNGIHDIILDPGFGFSKSIEQSFEILRNLEQLKILRKPILTGVSRKSMIYKSLGISPEEALNGSTVLHTIALQKGSKILRTHDVKEAVEIIELCSSI